MDDAQFAGVGSSREDLGSDVVERAFSEGQA